MRKPKITISIFLGIAVLLLCFNNCNRVAVVRESGSGTVVGNPMSLVSSKILSSVCQVVTQCHPQVVESECALQVAQVAGMNGPLGLAESYSTLALISRAEASGELSSTSSMGGAACADQVRSLTCDDAVVKSAYVGSLATPFAGTVNMLSGDKCKNALQPVIKYACEEKVFLRNQINSSLFPLQTVAGLEYSVSPDLPNGLLLDPRTGEISGTPTVVSASTNYTVTASSQGLNKSTTIRLRTADGHLVNSLEDSNKAGMGCKDSVGQCTLRAALQDINANSNPSVVVLPPGRIALSLQSELLVNAKTEILGDCAQGTTLDGLNATRILHIQAGPTALRNITFENGKSNGSGAGLLIDSANSSYSADLKNIKIQNNLSQTVSGGAAGLDITGPKTRSLTVTIDQCTIRGNSAPQSSAGGLHVGEGHIATLTGCRIEGNSSLVGGGLVVNGTAQIEKSLFQANTATQYGGAIYCATSVTGERTLSLTNVSITENAAGRGGGIVFANSGNITLSHVTIVKNHANGSSGYGGGVSDNGGGGTLSLKNSIIADNDNNGTKLNCGPSTFINSMGFNLSDSADCALSSSGDIVNQEPLLGPLQDNGGDTPTFALLPNSPALNKIPGPQCASHDQRGFERQTSSCDIGAFEAETGF